MSRRSSEGSARRLRVHGEPAFRTAHANPYNARLYSAMDPAQVQVQELSYLGVLTGPCDVVHLHWPELTFLSGHRSWRIAARMVLFYSFLRVARLRGTRLVWTAHNVQAHEKRATPFLRRWYRRELVANVDAVLTLSHQGESAVLEAYPELAGVPFTVTPHGHYREDYDLDIDQGVAREARGLAAEGVVVAAIGQVRRYKNVPHLIEVFREADLDASLVVAGKVAEANLGEEILAAVDGDARVRLDLTFLADETMAQWFRASDLVVLPYRAIENSGSAILALSAGRPVLVPAVGGLVELAELVGADWVRTYEGELDAATLADAVAWAVETPRPPLPPLEALEWSTIAAQTVTAYREVLAAPRLGRRRRTVGSSAVVPGSSAAAPSPSTRTPRVTVPTPDPSEDR